MPIITSDGWFSTSGSYTSGSGGSTSGSSGATTYSGSHRYSTHSTSGSYVSGSGGSTSGSAGATTYSGSGEYSTYSTSGSYTSGSDGSTSGSSGATTYSGSHHYSTYSTSGSYVSGSDGSTSGSSGTTTYSGSGEYSTYSTSGSYVSGSGGSTSGSSGATTYSGSHHYSTYSTSGSYVSGSGGSTSGSSGATTYSGSHHYSTYSTSGSYVSGSGGSTSGSSGTTTYSGSHHYSTYSTSGSYVSGSGGSTSGSSGATTYSGSSYHTVSHSGSVVSGSAGSTSGSGGITIWSSPYGYSTVSATGSYTSGPLTASKGVSINADDVRLQVGEGGDLYITHDGTNTLIANQTGHLGIDVETSGKNFKVLLGDDGGLSNAQIKNDSGATKVQFSSDGNISGSKELTVQYNIVTQGALNVSGAATLGSLTVGGASITDAGDVTAATLNLSNGGINSSGPFADVTTISMNNQLTNTLADGTAPFVITSTTKVSNLNADKLDGNDWAAPASLGSTTPAAVQATLISGSGELTVKNNIVTQGDLNVTGSATLGSLYFRDPTGLSDDTGRGEIGKFGSGTLTIGKLYYLHTDSTWTEVDADAVATGADQLLGIAMGSSPTTHGLLLRGYFDATTYLSNFSAGKAVYVSTTAASMDTTAPSAASDFVRVVGHCTNTANVIYFNPSGDWIEL